MSLSEEHLSTTTAHRGESVKSLVWEIFQTVLLTLLIFVGVRALVQNFRVEGASMEPNLHRDQYIVITKVSYARLDGGFGIPFLASKTPDTTPAKFIFGGPERGDVIVFQAPGQLDKDYIKRVIGLPGEQVRVISGNVFVNGKQIDEPYIRYHASYDYDAKTIPERNYFVLGDNRPNSTDSHLGWVVPIETIIGKAWLTYWPPDLWGALAHPAYAN